MKIITLSFLLLSAISNHLFAQTQIVAHRGFWNCEGSAQNSIAALKKAQQENFYGSEFDVLVTCDAIPVVNHDNTISGLPIENTPYNKIKNIKLKNGEKLPTLEDYLKQGKKDKSLKLILEIKPHKTTEAEDNAVIIITDIVKKYKLENQVEYISFSLGICKKIKELSPMSHVSYLEGNLSPDEVAGIGLNGIDYPCKVFMKNPTWIKDAQKLGLKVNTWTVNKVPDMRYFINEGIDYITTDNPLLLKDLLTGNKQNLSYK